MGKAKKSMLVTLVALILLVGGLLTHKSVQKHKVFTNVDFLSPEEKIYGLSVIWETAKNYYGMWDLVPELDWDSAYQDAIGHVLETDNLYEYQQELRAFVALLRDGHSQLMCSNEDYLTALQTGNGFWLCPISLQYMEDAFVVRTAACSVLKEVPLGSVVTRINGQPTVEYLEQEYGRYVGYHTHGKREDKLAEEMQLSDRKKELTLSGLTPEGRNFQVVLSYTNNLWSRRSIDRGDALSKELKKGMIIRDSFSSYVVQDTVHVAKISDFRNVAIQEEFATWIQQTQSTATAYILDVRGNNGGSDSNAKAVLRHFIASDDLGTLTFYKQHRDVTQITTGLMMENSMDELESGSWQEQFCQDGIAMYEHRYYVANKEGISCPDANEEKATESEMVALCHQPLVILTDWNCGSAGDDFAAFAKGAPNVAIIGTNTAGGTGQLLIEELPGEIRFAISTYNCIQVDGNPICNNGVSPDIWCEQTVMDALAGRDTVLLEAIEYLSKKK